MSIINPSLQILQSDLKSTDSQIRLARPERLRQTITFYVFTNDYPAGIVSSFGDTLETYNCDPYGNTTFVVHGWLESLERPWARPVVAKYLELRGNCVFFMDYSFYTQRSYSSLLVQFNHISELLAEKISSITIPENLEMFGFSFGARLVTRAGISVGENRVARIFACDPARPGFDTVYKLESTKAAKFISCIHTSTTYGTRKYDCHQDWRLGICGIYQIGARPFPYGSHGLCPYFFLSSFEEDFTQIPNPGCTSTRSAIDLPTDFIMGPRESRIHYGDIFALTSANPPWSGNEINSNIKELDGTFYEYNNDTSEDYDDSLIE